MRPQHVDGFSTPGEALHAVLVQLCSCESPVCPLPHTSAAVRAMIEPADLCDCTELRCRKPHTQEATARFVLSATGFRLWCLRHAGQPGGE